MTKIDGKMIVRGSFKDGALPPPPTQLLTAGVTGAITGYNDGSRGAVPIGSIQPDPFLFNGAEFTAVYAGSSLGRVEMLGTGSAPAQSVFTTLTIDGTFSDGSTQQIISSSTTYQTVGNHALWSFSFAGWLFVSGNVYVYTFA